jgi:hypothetical protein
MANPFPGVNPYIEANGRWTGFHNLLIACFSELLTEVLPTNYAAFVEERLEVIDVPGESSRTRQPDISVGRDVYAPASPVQSSSALLDVEPAHLTLPDHLDSPEAYIDIRTLPDQELITSIEVLSPSNKDHSGRTEYWHKRNSMIRQNVHLVEIDLLLDGRRLNVNEPLPPGDCYAFVSRGDQRPRCDVFHWSIRDAIPRLPIPLKLPDPDVVLDVGRAFNLAFVRHGYSRTLRYDAPLSKTLNDTDRQWAASLTKA